MNLNINNNTLVKSIQQQFTNLYPFLKIEFVSEAKSNGGFRKLEKLGPNTCFKALGPAEYEIAINISSNRTVAEVEKEFKEKLGLSIQLYRKSGNVWIETSLTDDWTLGRQNNAGEILSYHPLQQNAS